MGYKNIPVKRYFAGWEKEFYTMKSNKKYFLLYEVINNTLEMCRNAALKMTDFK